MITVSDESRRELYHLYGVNQHNCVDFFALSSLVEHNSNYFGKVIYVLQQKRHPSLIHFLD